MRSEASPLPPASSRSSRAPIGPALLMVLVMGSALQAQPPARLTDALFRFHPDGSPQVSAANAAIHLPAQILSVNPSATFVHSCATADSCASGLYSFQRRQFAMEPDMPRALSNTSTAVTRNSTSVDFNQTVYYKNKLEFSLDGGWLPINIPFVFDVFLGDAYTMTDLKCTLVPIIASLRWQINEVDGPWIFRGNWDLTASAGVTLIPRGPETHYIAWIMGIRRNFVPHGGKIAPYFDGRLGLGRIDAKAPLGVLYAQGQNFTFTMNLGSGVRYNINPRYSISAGLNWMHISNLYLSQPKFANYGINVYGPMFGIDVRVGRPRRHVSE